MAIDFLIPILRSVSTELTKKLFRDIESKKDEEKPIFNLDERIALKHLENNQRDIRRWVQEMPFFGFGGSRSLSQSITIKIRKDRQRYNSIYSNPKRKTVTENEILKDEEDRNLVLFGNPGGGKSTTLKRLLVKQLRLLKEEEFSKVPILIRMRELSESETVYSRLFDLFHIPYHKEVSNGRYLLANSEVSAKEFLLPLLNSLGLIIYLDGYDEVQNDNKSEIKKEIKELGMTLEKSRVILTSRDGEELSSLIESYIFLELQPLSSDQIKKIAQKWLRKRYDGFNRLLKREKYSSFSNRPLYLAFLIMIYERNGALPDQPSDVYREITLLILHNWDKSRDINRPKTVYSNFDQTKKLDFLAAIAFHLSYSLDKKIFNKNELKNIYKEIHEIFRLPEEEVEEVINEVESHNGILAQTYAGMYEFSHLSLQEYLAAKYLLGTSITQEKAHQKPHILAITCAISSDPNDFFYHLFVSIDGKKPAISDANVLGIFLERLNYESPPFRVHEKLGKASCELYTNLYFDSEKTTQNQINNFHTEFPFRESLLKYFRRCDGYDFGDHIIFKEKGRGSTKLNRTKIPRFLFNRLNCTMDLIGRRYYREN